MHRSDIIYVYIIYVYIIYIYIGDYHYIHSGKVVLDDLIFQILVTPLLRCETPVAPSMRLARSGAPTTAVWRKKQAGTWSKRYTKIWEFNGLFYAF